MKMLLEKSLNMTDRVYSNYGDTYILDYSLKNVNENLGFFQSREIYERGGRMIYDRIIQLCKQNGLSIAKLERETNISNGTIARWANSSPTAENLAKVADRFGVSVDYLMGRTEAAE